VEKEPAVEFDEEARALERAWEALWEPRAIDRWAVAPRALAYVPFDATAILNSREAIAVHLNRRRTHAALASTQWQWLTVWTDPDAVVACAQLQFELVRTLTAEREARVVRILIAAVRDGGRLRLVHLAEAPPAAIVELIRDYHAHAARARP
jgi:hypothetical protein